MIATLLGAVGIDEDIARLHVLVEHIGAAKSLARSTLSRGRRVRFTCCARDGRGPSAAIAVSSVR